MAISYQQFTERIIASGLLTAAELAEFIAQLPTDTEREAQSLARELISAGKLTKHQAFAVYKGETKHLVLGNYVILDKLGEGGMGEVYRARHKVMDREVALKVLPKAMVDSQDAIKRFHREVRAAAKLEHQNIVVAYDADQAAGRHFLVMQFVDGRDLSAVVKQNGPMSIDEAIDCCTQAARGLAYAHSRGVIHRDIKPSNLLLDKSGTIKILDMGLARLANQTDEDSALGGLTQSGQIMGTVDYMAPEQAENTREADHRADIYSLGCTLYVLLTAKAPFAGTTALQKMMAHQQKPIPKLSDARGDTPPKLDAVLARMLAKQPEERYQSMDEVIVALGSCLARGEALAAGALAAGSSDSNLSAFLSRLNAREDSLPKTRVLTTFDQNEATIDHKPEVSAAETGTGISRPPRAETAANVGAKPLPPTTSNDRKLRARRNRPWLPLALIGGAFVSTILLAGLLALVIWQPWNGSNKRDPLVATPNAPDDNDDEPVGESKSTTDVQSGTQIGEIDGTRANAHQFSALSMKFVRVPAGKSWLGGGAGKPGDVEVEFAEDFYIGKFEVTQAQWRQLMDQNPSYYSRSADASSSVDSVREALPAQFPVESVSWEDCQAFIARLNRATNEAGWTYRLPTEAEWEYACREGHMHDASRSAFSYYFKQSTNRITMQDANVQTNKLDAAYLSRTREVGAYQANALGLHDMHGNVAEWCSDNLFNDKGELQHVVRGGHWFSVSPGADAAYRELHEPNKAAAQLGLRLVRVRSHEFVNDIGMQFVHIPAGRAWINGGGGKPGTKELEVDGFYLGKFEVTQEQWQMLMGENPSNHSRKHVTKMSHLTDAQLQQLPVENVSWNDSQLFLQELNERCPEAGWTYRLPTWSEWDYAARGGPQTQAAESAFDFYAGWPSNMLRKDLANFDETGWGTPVAVGYGLPNRLQLYDMHGNVWEWNDVTTKGKFPIRGGSFNDPAVNCAVILPNAQPSDFHSPGVGLRVARVRKAETE